MPAHRSLVASMLASVLAVCSCAKTESPSKPKASDRSPAAALHSAEYFSVWGVGYAGIPTENERKFHEFMKRNPSAEDMLHLIQEGSPAGKIYGLLALKHRAPDVFAKLAPQFARSAVLVGTMGGCDPTPESERTGKLVKEIAAGNISISTRRE